MVMHAVCAVKRTGGEPLVSTGSAGERWLGRCGGDDRFVRRHIADPHQAEDVVAEVMLRIVRNCCEVTTDSRGELLDFQLRADGCGCSPTCETS
jgi:hypothetical protein